MTALGWRRGEDNLDLATMGCDIPHHLRKISARRPFDIGSCAGCYSHRGLLATVGDVGWEPKDTAHAGRGGEGTCSRYASTASRPRASPQQSRTTPNGALT